MIQISKKRNKKESNFETDTIIINNNEILPVNSAITNEMSSVEVDNPIDQENEVRKVDCCLREGGGTSILDVPRPRCFYPSRPIASNPF